MASVALFFDPGLRPPVFFPRIFLPSILEGSCRPLLVRPPRRHLQSGARVVDLLGAGKHLAAAIDDHKCAAAPFDVMLRESSGNLGKRKIGFGHIDTMPIAPRIGESS